MDSPQSTAADALASWITVQTLIIALAAKGVFTGDEMERFIDMTLLEMEEADAHSGIPAAIRAHARQRVERLLRSIRQCQDMRDRGGSPPPAAPAG